MKTPDSSSYEIISDSVSSSKGFYWTDDYTKGGTVSSGEFDFRVNDTNDNFTEVTGVTMDAESPNVNSKSPTGDTNNEDPTVSYSASDDHTSVDTTTINVTDTDDNNLYGNASSSSVDVSDLSDEEYQVSYRVNDTVGNVKQGTWTFTVDTSYDGDTDPSLNWDASESDGVILMSDDVDLTLNFDSGEEKPGSATCYDDYEDSDDKGSEIDSDNSVNTGSGGDYQLECEFDQSSYGGEEVDITVEVCDPAGNCDTASLGKYVFDDAEPTLTDVSTGLNVVNSNFTVEYTAGDESGIDELEYFYDDSEVDQGDGTVVNVTEDTEEFTADVSSLEKGNHTLYVRVKDNAGRWSSTESIDIEYLPNAEPSISLSVPDEFNLTAGESKSFDVTVENTGELLISDVNISASGIASGSVEVADLSPDETVTVQMDASASESQIGWQTVDVSADKPAASKSFDVRVLANQNQKDSVDSKLSNYQTKLEELKKRYSEMKGGLSSDLDEMASGNVSSLEEKVSSAQSQVQSGEYYRAQETLSGINETYSNADSSLTQIKEIDRKKDRNRLMMFGIAGLIVLGAGAGGFFYFSEEYDFNVEQVIDSDISVTDGEGLVSRVKSIFSAEEEAEEFEWNGFK